MRASILLTALLLALTPAPATAHEDLDYLKEALDLSSRQASEIREIIDEAREAGKSPAETRDEIAAVLNRQQRQEYRRLREHRRGHHGERGKHRDRRRHGYPERRRDKDVPDFQDPPERDRLWERDRDRGHDGNRIWERE